jgi:hypothetical protein
MPACCELFKSASRKRLTAQAICRYFGEPIDMADEAVVKKYCNKMCDVRFSFCPILRV